MAHRSHKLISEFLGTALLLVAVVGSGVAADKLTSGDVALSLFVHSSVIGATLVALILTFGGLSAHFNPAVSFFFALRKEVAWRELPLLCLAQIVGAISGVLLTHIMFELPLVDWGTQTRTGLGTWVSEAFCTFSLLLVIVGSSRQGLMPVAIAVGAFISGAIWCFSSFAFANPAVSLARAFTDTFTAIRPVDVGPFVAAQLLGATLAHLVPGFRASDEPE